jgi:hydroxypyruvate reductase
VGLPSPARAATAATSGSDPSQTWPSHLSAVASGPTCPDATTLAEARAVLERWLPGAAPVLQETPKPGDAIFARSRWHVLAGNADACAHLAESARAAGFAPVAVDATADEWESAEAARYLAGRWRELRAQHPRPCLIAGGEVRVRATGAMGRGGRNQHLALQIARALEGEEFRFLSAGTDGVDGFSDAAGALVDGGTCERARAAGFDPEVQLRGFDAEPLLEATGDLIRTGPTGNNLRDVRLFLP